MRVWAGTALAVLLAFGSARADDTNSPERMVLAKQILELSGALKIYDNYEKNLDGMMAQMRQSVPALDDATADELKKIAVEEYNASKPELIEGAARIYARHFTVDDLRALVAFYKTPAGQHFATEIPAVSMESVQLTAPFTKRVVARFQQYMVAKITAQKANQDASQDKSKDVKDK